MRLRLAIGHTRFSFGLKVNMGNSKPRTYGGVEMLLSDKRISEEMERGNIIIEPFEPRQLGTNSYDVRLGAYYFIPNHNMVTVNFTDEKDASDFWLGPYFAED